MERKEIHFFSLDDSKVNSLVEIFRNLGAKNITIINHPYETTVPQSSDIKAMALNKAVSVESIFPQFNILAENHGFVIKTLQEFPSVRGKYVPDTLKVDGIINLMKGKTDKSAQFLEYATYIPAGGKPISFKSQGGTFNIPENMGEPVQDGATDAERIIYIKKYKKTVSEMSPQEKAESYKNYKSALELFARWFIKEEVYNK